MKNRFGIVVSIAIFSLLSASANAQRAQRATVERQPARVVQQADASLQQALSDRAVQAEMRAHVRGVNTRRSAAQIDPAALVPIQGVQNDDGPEQSSRLMNSATLSALANLPSANPSSGRELSRVPNVSSNANDSAPTRRARPSSRLTDSARTRLRTARAPTNPLDLAAPPVPHLDVNGFADDLHAALQNSVRGYEMRMRRNGETIYTLQWNWAQTPDDNSLAWGPDRRMHVASISKFITAMGLTHLLDAQGISYNTPIINYLPDYWQTGTNVQGITFAHLMNHRSGIVTGSNSDASYGRMRSLIAAGVSNPGQGSGYANVNFALCRILMATIGGYIDTDANFPGFNDLMWNWITIQAYADYIQSNVFSPAGVNGPSLANTPNSARAYLWNDTGPGWDSADLMGQAGGAAWHISPDELLDAVGEFRRGGGIVSPNRAQQIFDASYGLNSNINGHTSPAGPYYFKPGLWRRNGQTEQALLMILPGQIEVVIFISSPIGPNGDSLQGLGRTLYLNNIIEP